MSRLLFYLIAPLIALYFYVNLVKWKRRSNLPPGGAAWPLIGDTFAYLKPHPATSIGHFMEQNISKYTILFLNYILWYPWE